MQNMYAKILAAVFLTIITCYFTASAQTKEILSIIPRVDVHAHVGTTDRMADYVKVSDCLKQKYKVNLALWIDLSFLRDSDQEPSKYFQLVREKYDNRFLPCINDFKIQDGLRYSPDELSDWMNKGVVGYKIWFGVTDMIDDPLFEQTFAKMEQIGMLGTSIHVAQPCPTEWCQNPLDFWRAQNAWERVLDRHSNLKVVNAHMLDHFNSDEQLDYLMYVLETYPNLHIDLAARFQQFHRMDRDKLRTFMIKYADRILYGTDIGGQPKEGQYEKTAQMYFRSFQLLETDKIIEGGFFSDTKTQGLALPEDVLKKIYYQNAARLYPRVRETLTQLGFLLD
jgi:predicted TIM-barrel fold metal-dependent hydrolase